MDPKETLEKGLEIIIDYSYEQLLSEYLQENILASEIDFIHFISQNQVKALIDLESRIHFFDYKSIDSIKEAENQIEKDKYWFYKMYQVYLNKRLNTLRNTQKQEPYKDKQQQKTSYVWQNNPDKELPELYRLMLNKYKLIAPETTLEQFKAVFTGQPINEIKPIRWHQDNASELLYFNKAIQAKVDNVWHIYQRLAACFVKPDGKPFNAVWKSLKTEIEINLSPDKQKAIDELVKNF